MIPDLEEDGGDGDGRGIYNIKLLYFKYNSDCMYYDNTVVARAPRNVNRKIPTLNELENDARAAIMMREVCVI